jgi:hypothetical protein
VLFLPKGIWGTLVQSIRVDPPMLSTEPAGAPAPARRT